MRCETEMMYQILQTAREDDRIRAVILNGSRTNSKKEPDFFQDFDVIYVVDEVAPFYRNLEWIKRFGELMILQMPDLMEDPRPDHEQRFTYLMQFVDGNRIDLTIYAKERLDELHRDSLSVLLLDKDGIVEPFPEPTEADYLPTPPTEELYDHCVNEFWWLGPYVAKGLWRQEIVFARKILDEYMRKQLIRMLTWYAGVLTDFNENMGKAGCHLKDHLPGEIWEMLLETYADADNEHTWDALMTMTKLFRKGANLVGEHFGYAYHYAEDQNVSAHLQHVRKLPEDAEEMY